MSDIADMPSYSSLAYPFAAVAFLVANGYVSSPEHRAPAEPAVGPAANAAIATPSKRAPTPSTAALPPERIVKSSDGLFYVTALVNGAKVRFLVDTGANVVVLTADDAQRAGVGRGATFGDSIETAGGSSRMDRVSLDRVDIAGRRVVDVDAAIMSEGLKVSLLGQNMLSKLGPITISGDEIVLK